MSAARATGSRLAGPLRQWRRARLATQLALFTAAVLAVTIAIFAALSASRQVDSALRDVQTQAQVLARNIATTTMSHLVMADLGSIEQLLLQSAEFPGIRRAQVSDRTGRLLSDVRRDPDGTPHAQFDTPPIAPPALPEPQLHLAGEDLVVWHPIMSGSLIGWVRLHSTLSHLDDIRAEIWRKTLVVAALAIGGSTLLLLLLLRPVLGALRHASDFAARLDTAAGAQIPVAGGPREIRQLIQALDFASTRLHEQDLAILRSANTLEAILAHVADGIVTVDAAGTITTFNRAAARIFDYRAEEAIGRPFALLLPPTRDATGHAPVAIGARESVGLRKDGTAFPMDLSVSEMILDERRLRIAVVRDITDRVRAQELAGRMGRILDNSSNEIYVFGADDLRFTQANTGALRNLGYTMDELRALTPLDLKPEYSREQFMRLLATLSLDEQEQISFETTHRRKDGSTYPVEVRLQLSRTETPPVYVAIIQDISERRHAQERLNYLAHFDALTGLPNRVMFNERLLQTMQDADIKERLVALMFLDLDRFKTINDTLGHEAGDELLKLAARRLTGCLRRGDTVARLGGDEFTVVLADVGHVDDVAWVANKILEAFARPFHVADSELFVTVSIGITLYPFDDHGVDGLLKNADMAMYKAKEQGRNNYQFYTTELNEQAREHLGIEIALRRALEREEFLLHFQPQVDLTSGRVVGLEALLRWHHPQRGLIPPSAFIPLAEENGLIVPIGEWVLRQCGAQVRAWEAQGLEIGRVAVNLSARQFRQRDLAERVAAILAATGMPADRLELEITESTLMHSAETTNAALAELKAMGLRLAIDDFGTGYSSLSYLKRFPIDTLKIDQSFVRDITHAPDDAAIITAIITMAHSMGMKVVAEGVETEDELRFLHRHRCDGMQGFLFSRPLPAEEFAALLRTGRTLDLPFGPRRQTAGGD
ncbi:MAG TPA: EAL domain-containing protein [Acidiferrobacterales bacterium]